MSGARVYFFIFGRNKACKIIHFDLSSCVQITYMKQLCSLLYTQSDGMHGAKDREKLAIQAKQVNRKKGGLPGLELFSWFP